MSSRKRRRLGGCAIVLIVVLIAFAVSPYGRAVKSFWDNGLIASLFQGDTNRKYEAGRQQNLKALYTAMMLYHEAEGQFPVANGWMDAIRQHIRTGDMSPQEADKKLVRPDLMPPKAGVFGYSMNDAASGKYKGDIKSPKTVLLYESTATARNAHGDPSKERARMGIALDGSIVVI